MAKEAYYFSHDSNARHDPKITAMRGVYGSLGYAWFWMLVEMMREADEFKLDMRSKYAFNAYAMQLQSECNAIASFVHDCIDEFNLFSSDGEYFWSESLMRRMLKMEERSEKARASANARWGKSNKNANASKNNADESKKDALKESKRNIKHSPEFDEFWSVYPRKIAKADAWKMWQRRIKDGLDTDYLINCAENYARACKGKDNAYTKYPASFLNEERYKDYEDKPKVVNMPTGEQRARMEAERQNEQPLPGFGLDRNGTNPESRTGTSGSDIP